MQKKKIHIDRDARCAYRQLSEILKQRIMSGEYLPGAHLPSVDDLCLETGLHQNTVKLAFKDLRDLGLVKFMPTVGCVVRDDMPCKIALILPENYGSPLEVLTGLNRSLEDYGRAELFIYKDAAEFRSFLKLVQQENYSGVAVYPEHSEEYYMTKLRNSGIPLVVIDNFHRDSTLGWYVDSGAFQAGLMVSDYLLDRNFETVALAAPDDYFGWKLIDGYWESHHNHQRSTSPYNVKMLNQTLNVEQATESFLNLQQSPKAIIYATPADALTGCRMIKTGNAANVNVFCFGNFPGADLWNVPLGLIERDYQKIGVYAGELLLEQRYIPHDKRQVLRKKTLNPILNPSMQKMKVPVCLITMVDVDMLPTISDPASLNHS